jgi:signal transduction histidine kinase
LPASLAKRQYLRAPEGNTVVDIGVSGPLSYLKVAWYAGLMLHEFLSANRAAIIERFRSKVDSRRTAIAIGEERESGVSVFLDQLIVALGPSRDPSDDAMGEGATKHGRNLLKRGFTVAQVVHDYGDVGESVTELAAETNTAITAEEFRTFNRCLDEAIARAVTEYARERDQAIADAGRERSGELAHELRNALGSAMISFDVLRSGNVGFSGSTAGVLARSLQRLSSLIHSSLAVVRLDAGIRAPERVSVVDFVEEVEVDALMEANARNVTLAVSTVGRGVDVNVDRQLLGAAVANLLQNAFKFGRRNGHVSLKTSATEERVMIAVQDECGGLPPDAATSLFRPFAQQGTDRTGLGLGLSITRKSVEANGGQVRWQDLPGVGCVFTIDLPRF